MSRYRYPTDRPDHHRECAMCGWQFDDDVNQQGDTLNSPGITYTTGSAVVKLPASGNASVVSFTDNYAEPVVISGCPFCGTYNPKGKNLDRIFGSTVNIENL